MDGDGRWDVRLLLDRAAAADERARAETQRAARAEDLAVNGSERLRGIHAAAARAHRRASARHRAAADIHRSLARQAGLSASVGRAEQLMDAVLEVCGAASVAMLVTASDGSPVGVLASDELASSAQQLEFVHGAGPMETARVTQHLVCAERHELDERWPQLGAALASAGVRGVVAAPLRLSEMTIGAIGVYDPPERGLGRDRVQQAADGVVQVIAEAEWPYEQLDVIDLVSTPELRRLHQAAGAVAAGAGCSVPVALDLIRARAFAEDRSADDVAAQVLEEGLRLSL